LADQGWRIGQARLIPQLSPRRIAAKAILPPGMLGARVFWVKKNIDIL
jgi:hypothetical protein